MSDPIVYAVASGKGGVGKTTTAVNLTAAFATGDRSSVVVDTDLGMATLATALGDVEGPTLYDVLADEATVEEASYDGGGFAFVPGGGTLEEYAGADPGGLAGVVETLRESFDVVVLDVGAGLSHDTLVPLGLADEILLVSTPENAALESAERVRELSERLDTPVTGLVLTRVTEANERATEAVEAAVGVPVLAVVPEDEVVYESAAVGSPVVANAPRSPVTAAYVDLAEALCDRLGEDLRSEPADEATATGETVLAGLADPGPAREVAGSGPDDEADTGSEGTGTDSDHQGTEPDEKDTADDGDRDDDGGSGGLFSRLFGR
jgi:septum site-determining protein MinD